MASRAARHRRSPGRPRRAAASGTSSSRRGSGPPARLALDWSTGRRTPASRGNTGTRTPERRRVGAARQREPPGGIGHQHGDRARAAAAPSRAARALAQLGHRRERIFNLEEHDRRRLVQAPALQQVQALDREPVLGVAGQSVHGVGREQHQPADPDAPLERLASLTTAADDDPFVAGQVAHAPRVAETRRSHQRRRGGLARPTSSATTEPRRPSTAVAGSGPTRQARRTARPCGLVADRSPAAGQRRRPRTAGSPAPRRTAGPPVEQVGEDELDVQPQPKPFARATASASGSTSIAHTAEIRSLVLQGQRHRPAPGPDVHDPSTRMRASTRPRPATRSRAAGSAPARSTSQRDPPERLAPEDVGHRLARLAPGHQRPERADAATSRAPCARRSQAAHARRPSASASSSSASSRGVSRLGASSEVAAPQDLGHRRRRGGQLRQPRRPSPPAAGASRRPAAPRSARRARPIRISSRLCTAG